MASLNMKGPYKLTTEEINEVVTRTPLSNHALEYVRDNTFYVCYVGRSDTDINERLKQWVGKKWKGRIEEIAGDVAKWKKKFCWKK